MTTSRTNFLLPLVAALSILLGSSLLTILLLPHQGWGEPRRPEKRTFQIPPGYQATTLRLCEGKRFPDWFQPHAQVPISLGQMLSLCYLPRGSEMPCQYYTLDRFFKLLSASRDHGITLLLTKKDVDSLSEFIQFDQCFFPGPEETLVQKGCEDACKELREAAQTKERKGEISVEDLTGPEANRKAEEGKAKVIIDGKKYEMGDSGKLEEEK